MVDKQIQYWASLLNEARDDLPEFLYHATTLKNSAKIDKHGVYPNEDVQWKDLSKHGVTYWAETPLLAALYVRMRGAKRDEIVIYKAPISVFDTNKLSPDKNYSADIKSGAFEYKGGIAIKDLEKIDL